MGQHLDSSFRIRERILCLLLVFSDAARSSECGQLGYVAELLIGDFEKSSVFHTLSWMSHLSRRPGKSSASAEVLAAGEAVDDGRVIASALSVVLNGKVHLSIAVDSRDLFSLLSTCRTPEDKSISAKVQLIRFGFETHSLNTLIWIPGSINFADALTKTDSRVHESLQLMMFEGTLPCDKEKNV